MHLAARAACLGLRLGEANLHRDDSSKITGLKREINMIHFAA